MHHGRLRGLSFRRSQSVDAWHGAADLAESKRVRLEADTLMADAAERLRAAELLQRQAHEVIERARNGNGL